jgi:hypothetical protein
VPSGTSTFVAIAKEDQYNKCFPRKLFLLLQLSETLTPSACELEYSTIAQTDPTAAPIISSCLFQVDLRKTLSTQKVPNEKLETGTGAPISCTLRSRASLENYLPTLLALIVVVTFNSNILFSTQSAQTWSSSHLQETKRSDGPNKIAIKPFKA